MRNKGLLHEACCHALPRFSSRLILDLRCTYSVVCKGAVISCDATVPFLYRSEQYVAYRMSFISFARIFAYGKRSRVDWCGYVSVFYAQSPRRQRAGIGYSGYTGIKRVYEKASVRTDFSPCAVHPEWLFQDRENTAVCLGSHDRG